MTLDNQLSHDKRQEESTELNITLILRLQLGKQAASAPPEELGEITSGYILLQVQGKKEKGYSGVAEPETH